MHKRPHLGAPCQSLRSIDCFHMCIQKPAVTKRGAALKAGPNMNEKLFSVSFLWLFFLWLRFRSRQLELKRMLAGRCGVSVEGSRAFGADVPPLASCLCPGQLATHSVSDGFDLVDANVRLTSQAFEC